MNPIDDFNIKYSNMDVIGGREFITPKITKNYQVNTILY